MGEDFTRLLFDCTWLVGFGVLEIDAEGMTVEASIDELSVLHHRSYLVMALS